MKSIEYIEEQTISIFVPMVIKRRGGGHATVILPKNSANQNDKPNYDVRMIKAFAKAYKWQQAILKNSNISTSTIAEKENITPTYVSRVLKLNMLAPDIVTAIMDGRQPRDLKLQDFMKKNISNLWCEQRITFGFMNQY